MSRYVEAETLVRWICGNKCGCERDECGYDIPCQQVQLLEGAPSINIVRCEMCKYSDHCEHAVLIAEFCGEVEETREIDFCSYGEREGEQ